MYGFKELVVYALALFCTAAIAQSAPSGPVEERTFFGFTVGEVQKQWPKIKGRPYQYGQARYWEDKFEVKAEYAPQFVRGEMPVQLQMNDSGVLQVAIFKLDNYESIAEATTPQTRAIRFNQLVAMVKEKLKAEPNSRGPGPWNLVSPVGRGFQPTELVTWQKPWGIVQLLSCSFDFQSAGCGNRDFASSLVIMTKSHLTLLDEINMQAKKDKASADAGRVKM